jgi:hypothetical protein
MEGRGRNEMTLFCEGSRLLVSKPQWFVNGLQLMNLLQICFFKAGWLLERYKFGITDSAATLEPKSHTMAYLVVITPPAAC